MTKFQRARKAAALLVAVLLVAGYVLYRGGGAVFLSGSKSSPTFRFVGSEVKPPATAPATPLQPASE